MGRFGVDFGAGLGSDWGRFGIDLGSIGGRFGVDLSKLGGIWDRLQKSSQERSCQERWPHIWIIRLAVPH